MTQTTNDILLSASALFAASFAAFVRAVEQSGDLVAAETALSTALGNYQAVLHHAASLQSAGAIAIIIQMMRKMNEDMATLQAQVKRLEDDA